MEAADISAALSAGSPKVRSAVCQRLFKGTDVAKCLKLGLLSFEAETLVVELKAEGGAVTQTASPMGEVTEHVAEEIKKAFHKKQFLSLKKRLWDAEKSG